MAPTTSQMQFLKTPIVSLEEEEGKEEKEEEEEEENRRDFFFNLSHHLLSLMQGFAYEITI